MPKRRTAAWYRDDKRMFIVTPYDWPKKCFLSFTERDEMVEWAHLNRYVLKGIDKIGRKTNGESV